MGLPNWRNELGEEKRGRLEANHSSRKRRGNASKFLLLSTLFMHLIAFIQRAPIFSIKANQISSSRVIIPFPPSKKGRLNGKKFSLPRQGE